ncbi:MAG TPA: alanine racemase [Rhodocyclaceae bacterium]|jgi:alanine racemase
MTRPIRARINFSALHHNLAIARRHAKGSHIWAVIKANGYGHGALRIAQALTSGPAGVDGFALVELETAIELREEGIYEPILLMEGFYSADELAKFSWHNLQPVIHSLEQIQIFCAAELPSPMPLHLKLNTGMNRLGLNADELDVALARLEACAHTGPITLMTHFADADEPRGITEQMARFASMVGGRTLPVSIANSAALLRFPETSGRDGDWVRPGIMLYGGSPFPAMMTALDIGLEPVMTLESELIAVRDLKAGDRVGYAGNFVADKPLRVGIVACGYGDGYPRHAPTGTPVLVEGIRTLTLGRVSMDKICVDLTRIPHARVGSTVTLWGRHGSVRLEADDVATAAGTVSYELFCAVARRVHFEETN